MIEQKILQQTDTKFHYSNGTVTFSKCNSPVGNKCNTIAHNAMSITGVRDVEKLRKQREVNSLSRWKPGVKGLLAVSSYKRKNMSD